MDNEADPGFLFSFFFPISDALYVDDKSVLKIDNSEGALGPVSSSSLSMDLADARLCLPIGPEL